MLLFLPNTDASALGLVSGLPSISVDVSTTTLADMAVDPNPAGTLVSSSHQISVSPAALNGYSLSISTTRSDNTLYNSYHDAINSTTGTLTSPISLTANTWGFAMTEALTTTNTITNGFDASYSTPTPSSSSKWAAVPSAGNDLTIKNTTTPSTTSDDTEIYYAVSLDYTQPAGAYTNEILYSVVANPIVYPEPEIISLAPSYGITTGGTKLTITGRNFTYLDGSITTAVTLDNLNCNNVEITANMPEVGQDTITCTTPAHEIGHVELKVTTFGGETTSEYTYSPMLESYGSSVNAKVLLSGSIRIITIKSLT